MTSLGPAGGQRIIQRCALAAFWLLLAYISFVTLAPVGFRPQLGRPALERFAAFFALGLTMRLAYPRRPWLVLAAICGVAFVLEALQLIMPTRDARILDAFEKLAGGIVGIGVAAIAGKVAGALSATLRGRQGRIN